MCSTVLVHLIPRRPMFLMHAIKESNRPTSDLPWQVKIEQRVEILQSHNTWLEEELSAKTDAVQQERRSVASQVCSQSSLHSSRNDNAFVRGAF